MDSGTTVRLQVWDTAGQERFRSISKLYYRGASAVILVYSIIDEKSFDEMGRWLEEVKDNLGDDIIIHVVGTKSDLVTSDPNLRKVPFERCIAYVADALYPMQGSTPPPTAGGSASSGVHSIDSKRNSGFWGQGIGWDVCHEISAASGEGIEEVFRVITRKLVEQHQKKLEQVQGMENGVTPGFESGQAGYIDRPGTSGTGSFRVGHGDKRRSWLGFPTPNIAISEETPSDHERVKKQRSDCC